MNEFIKPITSDKIIRWTIIISLLILLLTLIIIAFYYTSLPPLVPVFNQLPWGSERLGNTWMLFFPPFTALIIILGNIIFTKYIYEKMPLIARMLHTTGLLISIFSIIFIFRSIQLII